MTDPADGPQCQAVTKARPDRGQKSKPSPHAALPGSHVASRYALEDAKVRAEELAIAQAEDADRFASTAAATVVAAQNAWGRIKRNSTMLADYRLLGEGLLVGRRLCMAKVPVDKPRGVLYVRANRIWLREHGFDEITKSTRQCSMLIAEHWADVRAWLKTLPAERQTRINHPVSAWRSYVTRDRAPTSSWRTRKMTTLKAYAAAIEAVRREAPELDADVARRVAIAVMRSLELSIPREACRRNGASDTIAASAHSDCASPSQVGQHP